ncbi:hypothetical protein QQS21_011714 [Conoideocrella luteorostrata]|uniref:Synaptobrevin n=1 Tax=Conoideocrella luteorostrata TaxID=1105319 RepID=A0AAJ0CDN7_9HYPO|nr:hypothetical protein QQS21_011714 [Conoideocrella luteorostrata]
MARLSQGIALSDNAVSSPDVSLAELTQLLLRLQQNILHPTPDRDRRLRASEYERARVESILEYARSVLTKLEQDALQVKAPTKRAQTQSLLNANRDRLETLLDRLEDLRHIAADDDGSSDEEDLLAGIIKTPSESMDSASSETREGSDIVETPPDTLARELTPTHESLSSSQSALPATTPAVTTPPPPSSSPPTQLTQTMRSRSSAQPAASSTTPISPTSPTSQTSARAALFANRRKPTEPQTSTATAEAMLDQQKAEQDFLSESILKLASSLKESSKQFSSTLNADKEVLNQAGEGISKTELSMDSAKGRMGALRRMTEGKSWWGRMMLFAWVYGLMFGLVFLVFVMPKLRF